MVRVNVTSASLVKCFPLDQDLTATSTMIEGRGDRRGAIRMGGTGTVVVVADEEAMRRAGMEGGMAEAEAIGCTVVGEAGGREAAWSRMDTTLSEQSILDVSGCMSYFSHLPSHHEIPNSNLSEPEPPMPHLQLLQRGPSSTLLSCSWSDLDTISPIQSKKSPIVATPSGSSSVST